MKKADVWALGLTMYILAFNKFPFDLAKTEYLQMENICDFELSFKDRNISSELKEMIKSCLEKNPNNRTSIQDLRKHARFMNLSASGNGQNQNKPKIPRTDSEYSYELL